MQKKNVGAILVLLFCASQAFRDVYFANVFQGIDFFVIILLAFSMATLVFAAVAILSESGQLARALVQTAKVLSPNLCEKHSISLGKKPALTKSGQRSGTS